jgi:hypothetical protein
VKESGSRQSDVHWYNQQTRRTGDGNSTESESGLHIEDVLDGSGGTEDDGVGDETVLKLLDLLDHGSLLLGRVVVVDDTETSKELRDRTGTGRHWSVGRYDRLEAKVLTHTHGDGHLALGDCVHGRRDERRLEADSLGDAMGCE